MSQPISASRHPQATRERAAPEGERLLPWAIFALLVAAFIFGGGGVRYGLANLLVQLVALTILATYRDAFFRFWREAPSTLRGVTAATILVPVLHLIPLPESIWTALPSRDLVSQSFDAVGRSGWAPASVDPARTLVALTGLIVPITILAVGWSLSRERLVMLGWGFVALGLATFLLGSLQVLSNGATGVLFSERPPNSILYGTFANRNSTGVLLVGALAFATALPPPKAHPAALPIRLIVGALLALAIVLTRSRTALVLMALPLALGAMRAYWWSLTARRQSESSASSRGGFIALGAIGLGLVTAASLVAIAPGRIGETIERFDADGDPRTYIWDDATYTASRYWPVGAGMGTFDEVAQVDESLENATQRRPGRAHNDYLEIVIEAGAIGIALVLVWAALIGWFSWQARHSSLRWLAWAAATFLLAIALQSITDYPIRNQTILALASFSMLVLTKISRPSVRGTS